jgi:uncharacterized metal-binding protein
VKLICGLCKVHACRSRSGAGDLPKYCVMLEKDEEIETIFHEASQAYMKEGESRTLALAAARTEAAGYLRWPRVQEVMDFAWRIQANHLGIASCIGLIEEAGILHKLLEANGFQVSSVCCKVGSIPKTEVGLKLDETLRSDEFEPLCNPIGQAQLLNTVGTDLNILVGLCVGHDTLFLRNSRAPATGLIVKDRVTGHNPAVALYTSHSYYQRLSQWKNDKARE